MGFSNNHQIATPTFNQMHDSGVSFSNYYVQPSCSPTRATIITVRLHAASPRIRLRPVSTPFVSIKTLVFFYCSISSGFSKLLWGTVGVDNAPDTYSTHLFTKRAVSLIERHAQTETDAPLFIS
jgi:hypothetical protein